MKDEARLSPQERQALELDTQGLTIEEIAQRMMVSVFMVKKLLAQVYETEH